MKKKNLESMEGVTEGSAERRQSYINKVILFCAVALTLTLTGFSIYFLWDEVQFQSYKMTQGRVVSVETKVVQYQTQARGGTRVHDAYHYFANVEYEVNGSSYSAQVRVEQNIPAADDIIDIYYDPKHPTRCVYERSSHMILYLFSAAILLGAISGLWPSRKRIG